MHLNRSDDRADVRSLIYLHDLMAGQSTKWPPERGSARGVWARQVPDCPVRPPTWSLSYSGHQRYHHRSSSLKGRCPATDSGHRRKNKLLGHVMQSIKNPSFMCDNTYFSSKICNSISLLGLLWLPMIWRQLSRIKQQLRRWSVWQKQTTKQVCFCLPWLTSSLSDISDI